MLRPLFYGSVALPLFRFFHGPFMDRSQTIRIKGQYRSGFGTQRATLASQMSSRLPQSVSARRNVAAIYEQALSDLKEVELMRPPSQAKPAYTHYPILVPRGTRDRVVKEIWARGVDPGFNFSYLCGGDEAAAVAPVSEDYTHRIVTLPVSSRITPELAETIALAFRDAAVAAGLS